MHGLIGSVAALLQVTAGYEASIAAALGWAADAGAVHSVEAGPDAGRPVRGGGGGSPPDVDLRRARDANDGEGHGGGSGGLAAREVRQADDQQQTDRGPQPGLGAV